MMHDDEWAAFEHELAGKIEQACRKASEPSEFSKAWDRMTPEEQDAYIDTLSEGADECDARTQAIMASGGSITSYDHPEDIQARVQRRCGGAMGRARRMDWSGIGRSSKRIRESMLKTEPHIASAFESEEGEFEALLKDMGHPSVIEFDTDDEGRKRRFYAYWRKRMDELGKEHR